MGTERWEEFRPTLQPVYPSGFSGLSKMDRDILGNLDLSRIDHEGITQKACLILASVEAFHGARGCHWGHRTPVSQPIIWDRRYNSGSSRKLGADQGDSASPPPPRPIAFSQHLSCSAEGVAKGRDRASSPQGQGLLAALCTGQACVHRRPFPLPDTLTPVPSVSAQTSLLSGEGLSNPSPPSPRPPSPTICLLVSFMVFVTQKSRVCSLLSVLLLEHKPMEGRVFILFPTATMMPAYMRSGA